jgi:hypothetical protein
MEVLFRHLAQHHFPAEDLEENLEKSDQKTPHFALSMLRTTDIFMALEK